MADTAQELKDLIDSTIRNRTQPNSITVGNHSDLLYSVVDYITSVTSGTTSNPTGTIGSFTTVSALTANTPLQIDHNLGNENIITQVWLESTDELVELSVDKYSADTANSIIVESTISDTFRFNVISLSGINTSDVFNTTTGLLANTPQQITHNLGTDNIIVQTWDEGSGGLVDIAIEKYSGDPTNILVVESTVSDTFRINIIGL